MRTNVIFPTLGMLAVLTMGSMANFTVAVIAPAAAPDIGVPATYIGMFTSIVYVLAMVSGTLTGAFIHRYGAIRVCQFTMLMAAAGMLAIALLAMATGVYLMRLPRPRIKSGGDTARATRNADSSAQMSAKEES